MLKNKHYSSLYNYRNGGTPETCHTTGIIFASGQFQAYKTHAISYVCLSNAHASLDVIVTLNHIRGNTTVAQVNKATIPFGRSLTFPDPGQKWILNQGDYIQVVTPSAGDDVDITISYTILN